MLKLYNTLTRKLTEFVPLEKGKVRFYHCGPTVYWTQHIGNLRGMTMADLIRRSLSYLGYKLKFVRNYTDVGHLVSDADEGEDKMDKGAKREGLTPQAIAQKYIKIFENDTKALNIIEPDEKPQASQYVSQMEEMIQVLLNKGYAYITPKAVYFDVSKFPNYNQLNRQKIDFNQIGAGIGDVNDSNKKHAVDFALWFFKTGKHRNAIQYWLSPFKSLEVLNGEGFPGWHIECSAMSKALLGDTIDIHMGGIEHISVHHTNEIVQSEAANGVKFVNYWLHNEHLMVNGRKMAKSEGTGFSLDEVFEKSGFHTKKDAGMVLRYFFLNSHYRSKQNFTWDILKSSQNAKGKITDKMKEYSEYGNGKIIEKYKKQFIIALENDFNIPEALAITWNVIRSDEDKADKFATILDFNKVLSIFSDEDLKRIKKHKKDSNSRLPNKIEQLKVERDRAREKKEWKKSDELRHEIEDFGWKIEDTSKGTRIFKKV